MSDISVFNTSKPKIEIVRENNKKMLGKEYPNNYTKLYLMHLENWMMLLPLKGVAIMKRSNEEGNIRKRGQACWEGSVMIEGQRRYVYGKSSQEVRKKIAALTLRADLGLFVDESNMLLRDWLNQWITSYVRVKESTLTRYLIDIEQHISPALGNIPLCDLRTTHIQLFYNRLLKNGMSAKSLKNLHGVMHEALERAVMINLIPKNTTNACVLPKVKQTEMHPLKEEDVPRFLDAIRDDIFCDVYYVALFTGMRQGEILGLTWDSISFDQQTILISQQLQRSRKNREYCGIWA